MNYLVFPTAAAAQERSAAAWQALGYPRGATRSLWVCLPHPADGRAALCLPLTPEEAQIDVPQAEYHALLSAEERAAQVEALPGEGWSAGEF
ncbi:hypothetical protein [Ancylobacter sp. FA202]|uniref:hypothetical protein n=1 Tax=Ancylobacter sp. FA202 TaxID=1111106 RepID=UPI00037F2873|nr:hypothetical protein [Ancylobacter sp. FA202]